MIGRRLRRESQQTLRNGVGEHLTRKESRREEQAVRAVQRERKRGGKKQDKSLGKEEAENIDEEKMKVV